MNASPALHGHGREIAMVFLKLGAMSYGGPAIMGLMQTEVQEKRHWLSKENFVEGLALVNMLPGAGATQLSIFLGYNRAGWWGGLLAGVCFVLPALLIMLLLTTAYTRYGALPALRGVFYGLAPVVVGIFIVAGSRLGRAAIKERKQILFTLLSALALAFTGLGIIPLLLLAGTVGVMLYGKRAWGMAALVVFVIVYGIWQLFGGAVALPTLAMQDTSSGRIATVSDIAIFFFKVGAFSFGGGLSMLAFMQEQVVNQLHWLSPQQFFDGLALGQLTPGPILMVAAFVGYQLAGVGGAVVGAGAIFLPSFLLMLTVLPVFHRIQALTWMKGALKGISPAVIGMIALAMLQMLPTAVKDVTTALLLLATVVSMLGQRLGPLGLLLTGGVVGWFRFSYGPTLSF